MRRVIYTIVLVTESAYIKPQAMTGVHRLWVWVGF